MKESQIQRAILDLLAAERIPAWRMNSGVMSGVHNGKKRFVRFGEKGMADILAAPTMKGFDGPQFLWIEVKQPKGKVSPEQFDFCTYVSIHHMHYTVARSVDDMLKWLRDYR